MITALFSGTLIICCSILLVKAVDLFIKASTRIAHKTNISTYTLSFLLISLATSLPEVMVGVTSALESKPILSFSNVLGSNIALYTLIAGVPVLLFKKLNTNTVLRSKDLYVSALFSFVTVLFAMNGKISRAEGVLLLVLYFLYATMFMERESRLENITERFEFIDLWKEAIIFVTTLVFIIGSGNVIVSSVLGLSSALGIKLGVLGLTVTAIGTSLPEITYAIQLGKRNKHKEILGNILGSVVANSTVVLGLTAVITPINLDGQIKVSAYVFTLLATMLFTLFAKSGKSISKLESLILLGVYVLFVLTEYV